MSRELIQLNDMVKSISFNLDLLKFRLEKAKTIDVRNPENQFEYLTYFDAALVQMRAFLLESERYDNNFTIQILLKKIGKDEYANKINTFLEKPFDIVEKDKQEEGTSFDSIKVCLKYITDQFICHHDNICHSEYGRANTIMSRLGNKMEEHSIYNIFDFVDNMVREAIVDNMEN